MAKNSLHESLISWYARPGDLIEESFGGYLIDIIRGNQLIEVQTTNFSAIKNKLKDLLVDNPVRLVHPISQKKWIVRNDRNGLMISRRRSPRKGKVEDVFIELVYIPQIIKDPNFSLEVLLIQSEEVLIDDGRGGWRRRGWSLNDKRLLKVVNSRRFHGPQDFIALIPESIKPEFAVKEISRAIGLKLNIAQKMIYTLRSIGVIRNVGKRGRAPLYTISE